MQIVELYHIYQKHPFVCTDTRSITQDCIFFALKGETFNGNQFAASALDLGAKYVVVDQQEYYLDKPNYILVSDVLTSLQELAKYHRKQLNIPVIGITGTNGKTTSKELIFSVISQKYNAFCTKGNLNNHIGVPLSILSLTTDTEMAIIEMGANHVNEIAFLCEISQPTHGLITNVGMAHLEGFGSFEGVIKTKGELYDYLLSHQGWVFIQSENEYLMRMAKQRNLQKITYYGASDKSSVIGSLNYANPYLSIFWQQSDKGEQYEVSTKLTGTYNIENILAAIAIGLHFDLSAEQINTGLIQYTPQNNRSQITKTQNNTLIADYYNANASSMDAAIQNLALVQADKKVAILGDMFEMGDQSEQEHKKVIEKAKSIDVDRLIFVGKAFFAQRDAQAEFYQSTQELLGQLSQNPIKGSMILLKASRGMAFEQLIKVL